MSYARRTIFTLAVTVGVTAATFAMLGWNVNAQQYAKGQAVNNLPNPYMTIENFFAFPDANTPGPTQGELPKPRQWGSSSTVDIDKDGKTIWIAERCGANSCLNSPTVDPVLHFDERGKLLKSFGAGMILFPHGIHVDRDGNIWIADGQGNPPPAAGRGAAAPADGAAPAGRGAAAAGAGRGGRGAAADGGAAAGGRGAAAADGAPAAAGGGRGAGAGGGRGAGAAPAAPAYVGNPPATFNPATFVPPPGATKGHQVFKFSPDGKVLMTIGKPGGAAPPECCYQPNDVITNAAGEIFISEGHNAGTGLIFKYDKTGKLIKIIGKAGTGPGEFSIPHALAFDSRGRLFVADRGNVRIQILDQEGKFLEEWYQFSRLSGIFIDKNDMLYGADSESSPSSNAAVPGTPAWIRGIRIGSAKDGKVQYFIPDPEYDPMTPAGGTSAAEGVAADAAGNVYGAEVGPRKIHKYVKRP